MNLFVSLRYLVALDDHQHFGRAALACHVSQPALSNALRALEEYYGIAIIKRARLFAGFTTEGKLVLVGARSMLYEQEQLRQALAGSANSPQGNLLIGAVPTAIPLAARFAAKLRQQHPGIKPTVRSMSATEIEAGLEQLALDVGFGYTERITRTRTRLQVLHQYDERYYLLRRSKHDDIRPLSLVNPIKWSDAASHPLCLLGTEMHNRTVIDRTFASVGCTVEPVIETNSIMTLILAVIGGNVCSVLPGSLVAASDWFEGFEACRLFQPDVAVPVSFIAPSTDRLSRTVQAALALAQNPEWLTDVRKLAGDPGALCDKYQIT